MWVMRPEVISITAQRTEALAKRLSTAHVSTAHGRAPSRCAADRAFAQLLELLHPRIARLIRQYRLEDLREDAEQAAAIGVHRALLTYDPAKASFATHATWQMRGELQSLRHRMRLDQRRSARNAGVRTVSLDSIAASEPATADTHPLELVDDAALQRAESAASDHMAGVLLTRLLERIRAPLHERPIVRDHVLGDGISAGARSAPSPEQRRQIIRRTMRKGARALEASGLNC